LGAKLGAAKGGFSDINMTPLIDIVLVVLIIMMVNIPIQIEEMGLKLPAKIENPPPPPLNPPDQLVIALYKDGTIALNRRLMPEQTLFFEITRRLRPMDPKNVFIDGDPAVPFGRIVDMMDLAREAGAAKVGLTKMKDTGPLPATEVAQGAAPRGMTIGSPLVVGALEEQAADDALQPWKGNLEKCYLDGLATHPGLNGRVMGRVNVGPDGQIMEHRINSSTLEGAPEVEGCIDTVLGNFKYPPLGVQKTAGVQYPMLFSPG
jgi:biopolymer transport protein ExbD